MLAEVTACLPELYFLGLVVLLFGRSIAGVVCPRPLAAGNVVLDDVEDPMLAWLPALVLIGAAMCILSLSQTKLLFGGAYRVDALSQFFKLAVAIGLCLATANARSLPGLERRRQSDYFLLLCLSAWGLMLLSSAVELLTIYLAMEIASYSLYALIPLRSPDQGSSEAGVKYILFGAVATGLSLYGFSYVLAGHHASDIATLSGMDWSFAKSPMAVIGLTLFLCGMFFKLALLPFHFWCPDVYQGTANETAAYVATLPKLGAVVVLVRLTAMVHPGLELTHLLAMLGAASMTFGNLAALAQRDIKRLLGWSSVAHAGYLMLGLVAGTAEGLAATAYYSLAYVLMNLLCFWVICRISHDGRNLTLDDLDGLHHREPALALALAIGALSLLGLPPTAGFTGKLFLISALWGNGYDWLVILTVINTAISLFYYLSLVRHAYTHEGPAIGILPQASRLTCITTSVLAAAILLLGIFPGRFYELAWQAGSALLP